MKRRIRLLILAAVLVLFCVITISITGKTYTLVLNKQGEQIPSESISVKFSPEGIVSLDHVEQKGEKIYVTFRGEKKGVTEVEITYEIHDTDGEGREEVIQGGDWHRFWVHTARVITDGLEPFSGNFSGYQSILIALLGFLLIICIQLFLAIRREIRRLHYSYEIMTRVGLLPYLVGMFLMFFFVFIGSLRNPYEYNIGTVMGKIGTISENLVMMSLPVIVIFSLALSVSNVALLHKEGYSLSHALGIILSVLLMGGSILILGYAMPSITQPGISTIFYGVLASILCYFEAMLAGACYCGWYAGHRKIKHNKDFIIILGCAIAKDGSLLPLLKGRVDKAIEFYRKQIQETGRKARFVPSGGQGSDECISEAEAMKRYLLTQGIQEEEILLEDQSVSTYQNMKFSKEKIQAVQEDANVAFSTTNYHVFRSGVFANQVGLQAKGMGSKTKWYFWPNAFIREFIGMLASEKKAHALMVFIIVVLAVVLSWIINIYSEF